MSVASNLLNNNIKMCDMWWYVHAFHITSQVYLLLPTTTHFITIARPHHTQYYKAGNQNTHKIYVLIKSSKYSSMKICSSYNQSSSQTIFVVKSCVGFLLVMLTQYVTSSSKLLMNAGSPIALFILLQSVRYDNTLVMEYNIHSHSSITLQLAPSAC